MTETVFVDTNVLVSCRDASEKAKQPQAQRWLEQLWLERAGRLSTQVLTEYYVTVTRKLSPGLEPAEAREDVRDLAVWKPVTVDAELLERSWIIEDRYGLSVWDSLIVAAASKAGCRYLLTEDLQEGQLLGGVEVVSPFGAEPTEILG